VLSNLFIFLGAGRSDDHNVEEQQCEQSVCRWVVFDPSKLRAGLVSVISAKRTGETIAS